jgi:hypothetical protein
MRIGLEVDAVGDSLSGRVVTPGGETREFTGWLGLLGALEALISSTEPDRDGDRPRQ